MVHRFFQPTNKATRILVSAVRPRTARRANYSKGPPPSPSRERHNANARRTWGRERREEGVVVPGRRFAAGIHAAYGYRKRA